MHPGNAIEARLLLNVPSAYLTRFHSSDGASQIATLRGAVDWPAYVAIHSQRAPDPRFKATRSLNKFTKVVLGLLLWQSESFASNNQNQTGRIP